VNNLNYLTEEKINAFIESALKEDVGQGDFSTLSSVNPNTKGKAKIKLKEEGVIAGIELAEKIFKKFDSQLQVITFAKDGDYLKPGEDIFTVAGSARSILTTERLVLNCMQRMSGIATKTRKLSGLIQHTSAQIMDTRKTTPNFRMLEKWAVAIGGGKNHRFALYDMVMLKDNHIDFAGGIKMAIKAAQQFLKENQLNLKIEVETRNLEEIKEVLEVGGVDFILLDNMDVDTLSKAVQIIGGRVKTEASGGITEKNLVSVAETGVDYISIGALTHQIQSLDMSLKAFT
jgi:nicotinate-nucleotide pyrophosphorylase (carboxylating)